MDNLDIFNLDNENGSSKYYCHTCEEEISSCTLEYTCPRCSSGFIEKLNNDVEHEDEREESMDVSTPRPMRRAVRRTRIAIRHLQPNQNNDNVIPQFLQHFMSSLMGVQQQTNPINIQLTPLLFNSNDFVWTRNGLDDILTMFMNQLENTGPPPANNQDIDSLPTISIDSVHVENTKQCQICMEDFILDEQVKKLPCQHLYHKQCILPWLQLHGTCPVCRKTIESPCGTQEISNDQRETDDANIEGISNDQHLKDDSNIQGISNDQSQTNNANIEGILNSLHQKNDTKVQGVLNERKIVSNNQLNLTNEQRNTTIDQSDGEIIINDESSQDSITSGYLPLNNQLIDIAESPLINQSIISRECSLSNHSISTGETSLINQSINTNSNIAENNSNEFPLSSTSIIQGWNNHENPNHEAKH